MAVIRESRQFKIGPVGVVRASTSGQIVGEAVSRSGDQLSAIMFQDRMEDAQISGAEAAEAVTSSEIIELDPKTGDSRAYKIPDGFGRYAQQAYQKVILRRFDEEIALEMDTKAGEFAVRFDQEPEQFKEAMSDYIASMANVEESSVFKEEILRRGKISTQSKYRALQLQAIDLQRKRDGLAYDNSILDLQRKIESAAVAGDDEGVEIIRAEIAESSKEAIDAKIKYPEQLNSVDINTEVRIARGILQNQLRTLGESSTPDMLNRLTLALDAGDPSLVPDEFNKVKDLLSNADADLRAKISEFGVEMSNDRLAIVTYTQSQNALSARIDRENPETGNASASAMESFNEKISADSGINFSSVLSTTIKKAQAEQERRGETLLAGWSQDVADTMIGHNSFKLLELRDVAIKRLFSKVSKFEDLSEIREVLVNPTQENVLKFEENNPSLVPFLNAIKELDKSNSSLNSVEQAITFSKSMNQDTNFDQSQNEAASLFEAEAILTKDVSNNFSSATSLDDLMKASSNASTTFDESGLNRIDRSRIEARSNNLEASNAVRIAFSNLVTKTRVTAAQNYLLSGNDKDNFLTDKEKEALDHAKKKFSSESSLRTSLNTFKSAAINTIATKKAELKQQRSISELITGNGDGSDREQSDLLDKGLNIEQDFFYNEAYLKDPDSRKRLEQISQGQSAVWSGHFIDSLEATATGSIPLGGTMKTMLVHFDNARDTVDLRTGIKVRSGGYAGIKASTAAYWDVISAFAASTPNASEADLIRFSNQYKIAYRSTEVIKKRDAFFGDLDGKGGVTSLDSYVLSFDGAQVNPDLQEMLKAAAISFYVASVSGETESSEGSLLSSIFGGTENIDDHVKDTYNRFYVNDPFVKGENGQERTAFPLTRTVGGGNEALFEEYVRSTLVKYAVDQETDWTTVGVRVQPTGRNLRDGGMTYAILNDNGDVIEINLDPSYAGPGSGIKLPNVQAFISTKEANFVSLVEMGIKEDNFSELSKAETLQKRDDLIASSPLAGRDSEFKIAKVMYQSVMPLAKIVFKDDEDALSMLVNLQIAQEGALFGEGRPRRDDRSDFVPTPLSANRGNQIRQLISFLKPMATENAQELLLALTEVQKILAIENYKD